MYVNYFFYIHIYIYLLIIYIYAYEDENVRPYNYFSKKGIICCSIFIKSRINLLLYL